MDVYNMPIYLLHRQPGLPCLQNVPPDTSVYKIKQLFTQRITMNALPKGYNLRHRIWKRKSVIS